MRRSPEQIKSLLRALADRDWPAAWGADEKDDDYCGWHHRYRLNEPLLLDTVAAFEQEHGVELPHGYRTFLVSVGNGGAGPAFGLCALGTQDDAVMWPHYLEGMGDEFDADDAERWEACDEDDPAEDAMRGTIPIATTGCCNWYHLVVTGPCAGEIWYDPRAGDLEPPMRLPGREGPMHFDEWYESWLDECEQKWLPLTKYKRRSWWRKAFHGQGT